MSETFRAPRDTFVASLHQRAASSYAGVQGEVFITLTSREGSVQEQRHIKNVVCRDASVLIARLMMNPAATPHGVYALAVGTGDPAWGSLPKPPAGTNLQRALYHEVSRKAFSSVTFVDGTGATTQVPTNVVDFTATFAESDASGETLREMGLVGGNAVLGSAAETAANSITPAYSGNYDPTIDLRAFATLVNYTTFAALTKPATSALTITWRLTF